MCSAVSLPTSRPATLVGRSDELLWVVNQLAAEGLLTTVWGPPGVGKTRLAREALLALPQKRSVVLSLIDVHDSQSLLMAVAGALELSLAPSTRLTDLSERVSTARAIPDIVVVDNVEHVVDLLVPVLDTLRNAFAKTSWLVTSRECLRARGECVLELRPLADDSAVALLRSCAADLGSAVTCSDDELRAIVRAVDGLPLAIELAAPRLALLGASSVIEALARSSLLVDAGARNRGLRAAIEASWQLLDSDQQRLLSCLWVFRGGFDEVSACAVAALDPSVCAVAIEELVRKSLVAREFGEQAGRLRLLVSVRCFAEEKSRQLGGSEASRVSHSAWFAAQSRRALAALAGPSPLSALRWLRQERENLVFALCAGSVEDKLDVLAALEQLLEIDGPLVALVEYCQRTLDAIPTEGKFEGEPSEHVLLIRAMQAEGLRRGGRYDTALRLATSLEVTSSMLPSLRARVNETLGYIALVQGRLDDAAALATRAVSDAHASADIRVQTRALALAGNVAVARGAHREAVSHFEQSLRIAELAGWLRQVVRMSALLGSVYIDQGWTEQARLLYERAERLAAPLCDRQFNANIAVLAAMVAHRTGELTLARERYLLSASHARSLDARWLAAVHMGYAALVLVEQGQFQCAVEELQMTVEALRAVGDRRYEGVFCATMGVANAALGRIERGLILVRDAVAALESIGDPGLLATALFLSATVHWFLAQSTAATDAAARSAALETKVALEARALKLCTVDAGRIQSVEAAAAFRLLRSVEHAPFVPEAISASAFAAEASFAWIRPPFGSVVSMRRKPLLRELVRLLVSARERSPDERLTRAAIQTHLWPGVKLPAEVAANRIRVAINALRNLGLQDILRHGGGGWFLSVDCERVDPATVDRSSSAHEDTR